MKIGYEIASIFALDQLGLCRSNDLIDWGLLELQNGSDSVNVAIMLGRIPRPGSRKEEATSSEERNIEVGQSFRWDEEPTWFESAKEMLSWISDKPGKVVRSSEV